MSLPLYQVDAFCRQPFGGNPAAVCVLDAPRPDPWMQAVAAEMNLSETAFLLAGEQAWSLRWFTPTTEVDLCGHATLASAHVLWESGRAAAEMALAFDTRSGRLGAERSGNAIALDFPAIPVRAIEAPDTLASALGGAPRAVHASDADLLVELASQAQLLELRPDFGALGRLPFEMIVVTAPADASELDMVSRVFAPGVGIDEDPVTGSAHCLLAPFWAERLGRTRLSARQLSRRGGELGLELCGQRVRILGQAVTVMRGELVA